MAKAPRKRATKPKTKKKGWKKGRAPRKRKLSAATIAKRSRFEAQMIRDSLEDAARGVESRTGAKTIVRVHTSRDGTVDGELRVIGIPRGVSVRRMLTIVEESATWPLGEEWISQGIVFGVRPREEEHVNYKRRRGHHDLGVISTHYMHTSGKAVGEKHRVTSGYAGSFAAGKDMADRLAKNDRRKPSEIMTRVHWNPQGVQPKRRY